jgi:hypothetical protein
MFPGKLEAYPNLVVQKTWITPADPLLLLADHLSPSPTSATTVTDL